MYAKKELGQHFLTSEAAVAAMVSAGEVSEGDTVVEIGPGKGVLTQALLDTGARVIAVEKDADLIPTLHERFRVEIDSGKLVVQEEDVRGFTPPDTAYKLIANIPYYITGDIIRQFLGSDHQPSVMVLLMQKEVARRIVARDGKESILSLSVKAYGTPAYVQTVRAGSFMPKPKVDSAILKIEGISKNFFDEITEEAFFGLIKKAFSQKRKQLVNTIGLKKEDTIFVLTEAGLAVDVRSEDISLSGWKDITQKTTKLGT